MIDSLQIENNPDIKLTVEPQGEVPSPEQRIAQLEKQLAETQRLLDEERAKSKLLESLSMTDTLTELPNRRFIQAEMERKLQEVARGGNPFAVVMVDVDNFRQVNESFGHPQGDTVLKELAIEVGSSVRGTDTFGRLAGDEFMVLLTIKDLDHLDQEVASFLKRYLNSAHRVNRIPANIKSLTPEPQTISLGCAVVMPFNEVSPDEIYKIADELAYRSKEKGKNCYTVGLVDEFGNHEIGTYSDQGTLIE
ncbi:MAG TPA: GGDEF domain-containing protein [Patescibacteria group bacterium]